MPRKLLQYGMVVTLLVAMLLLLDPVTPATAAGAIPAITPTPTPDVTATLNAANSAISHAQDLLNTMNIFATILGIVLTLFSLVAAVLAFLGLRSYREVLALTSDLRSHMTAIREEADKTRHALVYLGLGDRLLSQKNVAEAIENYKNAERLLPQDAQLKYVIGRIYSSIGDYDAAITTLEAAHPEDAASQANVQKELGLAYRRRGQALHQEADYDVAIQCLKKALALHPGESDTHAILGGLFRRKGDYHQAFVCYERAWRLNPGSSYALGNLASLSWYLGKVNEAHMYFGFAEVAAAERIKKGQFEVFWDYYDLALAQLAMGKIADAQQTYALAIKETPGKVQFESALDNLYLLQKAPQAMDGLDDIVSMLKNARDRV